MTTELTGPVAFPSTGTRLLVYVIYDRRGDIADYVLHALRSLRPHFSHILAVVNGALTESGHDALSGVVDEHFVRANEGFDIVAHRDALEHLGHRISAFDEVVLANDTWYGPVRPFEPVFARMDARAVDFWGMTEHPEQVPHPFTGTGVMPRHLQSFWIAVRRRMIESTSWRDYWRDLPAIDSYNDAILRHETVFTEHFEQRGYLADVAFPAQDYPSEHAAIFHADLLLRDGCPILKRRTLFHHPTFLARNAIIGRDLVREAEGFGFPTNLIYSDLARNVAPRTLNADLGLFDVRSPGTTSPDANARVALIVANARAAHADAVASWASCLSSDALVVADVAQGDDEATISSRWRERMPAFEILLRPATTSNAVRPLRGAEEIVSQRDIDIVVHVNGTLWDKADTNEHRFLQRQQLESILGGDDPIGAAVALFAKEPGLGFILPPTPHVGQLPEAIRWPTTRPRVVAALQASGIRVPVDEFGPLASAGGTWIARAEAIRTVARMVTVAGAQELVADDGSWDLADLLLPYAMAEAGFHARTVTTAEFASIAHTSLEYTLDRLLETTYGYRLEQIQFLQRAQWRGNAGARDLMKMHMRLNHPDGSHPLLPIVRAARRMVSGTRSAMRRARAGGAR